jgi:putative membrane-bound dehydrogenase-like protein
MTAPRLFITLTSIALLAVLSFAADDRPLPTSEAAARMTLPPGFRATLFAGEPDLVQPIAFTFDDRGRLWVVESYSYPNWTKEKEGRDRVLIFEDTDGDGRFDKRTVFWDKGANLSGIQVGFGGVWLCATPSLIFIPVNAGKDLPAGPPEVVLDGWNLIKNSHTVFNGLDWGPDGWLYGCNGIQCDSHVGRPGTPAADRVTINCGVWRYHPTRKVFEAYAHGTTNPWGLDWDDYGEMFITNCVIDHLWQVVPGGRYERMYGQDFNPHAYALMKSCCDHRHWAGGPWQESRGNKAEHNDFGGGHAHAGCMIYLGDTFPPEYRNSAFLCNIHGNRVNRDRLERTGSGYVARHAPDFLLAHDPWFRGLGVHLGPDGVYVSDWCDTGECHNHVQVDQTNGRIFKVVHGTPKPWRGDLATMSDAELVKLQTHSNDWLVRHARRLLQERATTRKLDEQSLTTLFLLVNDSKAEVRHRLRALWTLHSIAVLESLDYLRWTDSDAVPLAAWSLRLFFDVNRDNAGNLQVFEQLFGPEDLKHPPIQLSLASAVQWVTPKLRSRSIHHLLAAVKDGRDFNLAQLVWLAIEPTVPEQPAGAVQFLDEANIPWVRECIARRLAPLPASGADSLTGLDRVVGWLASSSDADRQADVLAGIQAAFGGRRELPMPSGWAAASEKLAVSPSAVVQERATQLAVLFGDPRAVAAVRQIVADAKAPLEQRRAALQMLQQQQRPDLVPLLHGLLTDRDLRGQSVVGLAAFNDAASPGLLLKHFATFADTEKAAAVATLSARPASALALLDALEAGTVSRGDVSVYAVRQLQSLKDRAVTMRIEKVWGKVKPPSQEKKALIALYKSGLKPEAFQAADLSRGRQVFVKTCASCHRLFDDGARIGPELTGSQRANLDYVLENTVDPNALVPREYRVTRFALTSGRVVDGIVVKDDAAAVTLQTPTEQLVVPKAEIESRETTEISLMPEGLLETLTREQVRDLVAYLASPVQVSLPK